MSETKNDGQKKEEKKKDGGAKTWRSERIGVVKVKGKHARV